MEDWKDIEGYDGLYKVSNTGIVKSFKQKKERIISQSDDGKGYKLIALWKDNKQVMIRVHRLVALSFVENLNPEEFNHVCHKDHNKSNNNFDNLYWGNNTTNTDDKVKANRQAKSFQLPQTKLSETDKENILMLSESMSQEKIAKEYNVSQAHISRVIIKLKKRDYE